MPVDEQTAALTNDMEDLNTGIQILEEANHSQSSKLDLISQNLKSDVENMIKMMKDLFITD